MRTSFTLDGKQVAWDHEAGEDLRSLLERKGIVSARDGCDREGSCGLCTVIMDGRTVSSCLVLAAQAAGTEILTIASWKRDARIASCRQALIDAGCVQCGYCTPAVALALASLLERCPDPGRAETADALSGVMCRCTGYEQFFQAARLAARRLSDPSYSETIAPEFRRDLAHVGKVREKVDAAGLASGERAFVEDRVEPGTCVLKVLASPHAAARITRLDASAAEAMPGVVAVYHHGNCPKTMYGSAGQGFPEPSPYDRRLFSDRVRHVGDRVAAVLAETREEAEAAVAAIRVEYERLPAVLSMDEAAAPGAPAVHGGEARYVAGSAPSWAAPAADPSDDPVIFQFPIGADPSRNLAASVEGGIGDMEAGFREADVAIEREYSATRVQCTPLEPHVVFAKAEGGRLTLRASTQVPWHLRRIVAGICGIPENKVRVIKERVGGGFGAKQDIVVEDLAAWAAWTSGRPVLYRMTREEEFVQSRTRHPMKIRVRLGAKRDGRLTAIDMAVRADTGAYGTHCLTVPMNACSKSLPLLLCPNARFSVRTYYTNLPQSGAYQGYGAPQGSFALQTALAELAGELGIGQLEMIERNMVRSGSTIEILKSLGEGREGAAVTLGECGLEAMIAKGRADAGWSRPKEAKPDRVAGRGAVIIQQGSGLPGLDAANAEIRLLSDGSFLLLSGGADLGTGLDTLIVKTAAEVLGVAPSAVAVLSGDTDVTPFDKGAYASSGTFYSGNAAKLAAEDLRAKILAAAALRLGEAVEGLRLERGGKVAGGSREVSFQEIAHWTTTGEGPGELSGFGSFKSDHAAFPYGAHFVEVSVDPRTGEVKLEKYYAYQDCGTPINPDLALGQIYGGVMKAVGHSLYEEMLFDPEGRCSNPNFLDYKVPGILDLPADFRAELMPVTDPVGPFGGKSVSEIALNGAACAIAIAIHDAVGAWVREWPFTPERVLGAMKRI